MKLKEITDQAKQYFGKDRSLLKEKILSFKFDGKQYKAWKRHFKQITNQPFDVQYKMFDDVTDWITQGEPDKIDWHWLGDVSWEIEIVLNEGIDKGYDWDKKLAKKCGGTVRFLQIFVSDVLPCYTKHYHDSFPMSFRY